MIKQASRHLVKPTDKLAIKLSVSLLDSYSLYETNMYDYLTICPSAHVTIQYKTNAPWDRNQMVHINTSNIFYWNKMIQSFYKKVQNPDLYTYYKSGNIEYNGDDSYRTPIAMMGGEYIELEPGIITDERGTSIPGIFMRINISSNEVPLSFDAFESMMYVFSQINIGSEAMQLIIAEKLLRDDVESSKKFTNQEVVNKPKVNIFQKREDVNDNVEVIEQVKDNRVKDVKPISSLDDIL